MTALGINLVSAQYQTLRPLLWPLWAEFSMLDEGKHLQHCHPSGPEFNTPCFKPPLLKKDGSSTVV